MILLHNTLLTLISYKIKPLVDLNLNPVYFTDNLLKKERSGGFRLFCSAGSLHCQKVFFVSIDECTIETTNYTNFTN